MIRSLATVASFLLIRCLGLAGFVAPLGAQPATDAPTERHLEFTYRASVGPIPVGQGPVHIFLPLVREDAHQRLVSEQVTAGIPGHVETEPEFGNRFWHGTLAKSDGRPIEVSVDTVVVRRVFHATVGATQEAPADLARYLRPDDKVPVGHPILDPILAEIRTRATGGGKAALARAIYDWVVDHLEYKKVGTGWGNGDTFWACNERYGNCTDFHSLFLSLARTEGIPGRFEMGFPVPEATAEGEIPGYHCWVEFWLPETGWFPIDASEAFKHPERRDLFYGTQPADRIHFTNGRDLRLGPDQRGKPLNYFVYPYVEVDGTAWTGTIDKHFSFRELSRAAPPSTAGASPRR